MNKKKIYYSLIIVYLLVVFIYATYLLFLGAYSYSQVALMTLSWPFALVILIFLIIGGPMN